VAGVHWRADILPVRVLTGCGGSTTDCADGIIWAVDHGADVGTLSLQYYDYSAYFEDATEYAAANDVLLVAAAGNNFGRRIAWPARFENVIAVGATDNRDEFAGFSNWGDEAELAAPGVDVYATWVNNSYTYLDGTSMATPHVAGVACLVRSLDPTLTADEVRAILAETADDLGPAGWDDRFGHGRINAEAALLAAGAGAPPLAGATPGATVHLAYTIDGVGRTEVPNLGVTLDLARPRLVDRVAANAWGTADFFANVGWRAAGRELLFQAAEPGRVSDVETRRVD